MAAIRRIIDRAGNVKTVRVRLSAGADLTAAVPIYRLTRGDLLFAYWLSVSEPFDCTEPEQKAWVNVQPAGGDAALDGVIINQPLDQLDDRLGSDDAPDYAIARGELLLGKPLTGGLLTLKVATEAGTEPGSTQGQAELGLVVLRIAK
jgi:hypothetical protein